eukprot:11823659-Alexandrium_andersonii.AAC.1
MDERRVFEALERTHQRLGHPSSDQFLRVLRFAKVPDEVLAMAKRYQCSACLRQARPRSVRPVAAMEAKEFNQ